MHRITGALAAGLLAISSTAAFSQEKPTDPKAPETNAIKSDAPANPDGGAAKPAGKGAPVSEDAASSGSSSGSSGTSSSSSSSTT